MNGDVDNKNGYFKGNIEARVIGLEKNVESILTNHLPHIQDHLEAQDKKLIGILTTLIGILLSLGGNLIIKLIK